MVGVLGGSLAVAAPANATVKYTDCYPGFNGVELNSLSQGCYGYYGDPHGGWGWINVYDSESVKSNWNSGYMVYTSGSSHTSNHAGYQLPYYANGQTYYYPQPGGLGWDNWNTDWIWMNG